MVPRILFAFLLLPGAALTGATGSPADPSRFHAESIHEILETHCFECHGGGGKLRGGFRITSREGLLRGGDLGPAFDEADPGSSLLLRMISYEDEEHQMPPRAKLPEASLAHLRQWIGMGAPFDPSLEIAGDPAETRGGMVVTPEHRSHWAYRPLVRPEVPRNGVSHPIDAFLKQGLDEAGLRANGPAPPDHLARRLHYNLTGLPPEPAELSAFRAASERDGLEGATRAKVEELLSRTAYGETWARHWLDLVRYAETNGFERDNPKPEIWRYRDYVIAAFRDDLPYDRFIIEQLAGDEVPEPTQSSVTATGFHRLMQWDDEPADRTQHVYDVLADNVLVTSETFLGSTLGCARCHDHKIDPFSQRDFYSFLALFHGVTPYATGGTIVPWANDDEKRAFASERSVRLAAAEEGLADFDRRLEEWLRSTGRWSETGPSETRVWIDDARGQAAEWSYTTSAPAPGWTEVGFRDPSWQEGRGGFGTPGTPGAIVGTVWRTPEIWLRGTFGLTSIPDSLTLRLHHDEDVVVYLNGTEVHRATGYRTDYGEIDLGSTGVNALQTGRNVVAVHCRQTSGGQYIDLSLVSGGGGYRNVADALRSGEKGLLAGARDHFGTDVVKERNDLRNRIEAIRKELPGTPLNAVTEVAAGPKPLHVHLRGSAHAPGDPVEPGFPAVLASAEGSDPVPATVSPVVGPAGPSSGRRLALARWIADPANPLTARVMVNRIWQHHFGRGIVPSASDFGKLGEAPSHPELLDWLASEFIASGWSVKAMHRLILSSEAARMSGEGQAGALAADPGNRLFWRFNPRRLTAEELRDSILAVTGTLREERRGGPWVFPPLPREVLATASRPGAAWPVSSDPADHFRRSVYIHVKRSLRHPFLADFDQADTDTPCAVRFATTVPTQSLAMLNSVFLNEQARFLAGRVREEAGDEAGRIRATLRHVTQREPSPPELHEAARLLTRLRHEAGLDEDTALERLALLALNLNEFVYLD